MLLAANDVVVLQGDSITDAGRLYDDPDHLGGGYAALLDALWAAKYPSKSVKFINRGISGNRVADLQARWQTDCLDYKPTLVSILIGVNDTWRRYDENDPTSTEAFAGGFRDLLARTSATGAKILILEPFLLPLPPAETHWREDLGPKIQAIRALAGEFQTLYVPLDGIFARAATRRPASFWAADGIHPTPAGHALIAEAWLREIAEA